MVDHSSPWILGFSASHNGAVCLLKGDEIVVAIQEERLTGEKRARIERLDESLAVQYCLNTAGITAQDLDLVVGAFFSGAAVRGISLKNEGWKCRTETIPHHYAHAVGAFATSGYDEAAILVVDGQGGFEKDLPANEKQNIVRASVPGLKQYSEILTIYSAKGSSIECVEKHVGDWIPETGFLKTTRSMKAFGSLGGMYASAAHAIFGDAMDSGKVMGLSALGDATFPVEEFFDHHSETGAITFKDNVVKHFQGEAKWPDNKDAFVGLAASVQDAVEEALFQFVQRTKKLTGSNNLCFTGGVALNAVANNKIIANKYFDDVFIQPAAEDSGPAIGAAFHGLWQLQREHKKIRAVHDSMGRHYSTDEVEEAVASTPNIVVEKRGNEVSETAKLMKSGAIIGWFDGGSELGPRALGHRSLFADPSNSQSKENMNLKVKHREPFRPFAPIVLEEKAQEWFDFPAHDATSPVMLRTLPIHSQKVSEIPAVAHYDGSGRVQTLRAEANPRVHDLISHFEKETGIPIILNTSFNVMGEPIIETPQDALFSILYTDIDFCVFPNLIVRRENKNQSLLALRPKIRATKIILEQALNTTNNAPVYFAEIDSPWGKKTQPIPAIAASVIRRIDGKATGMEIFNMLRRETGLDEKTMSSLLHLMRRRYIISLGS